LGFHQVVQDDQVLFVHLRNEHDELLALEMRRRYFDTL
jgi:hypothetical protein